MRARDAASGVIIFMAMAMLTGLAVYLGYGLAHTGEPSTDSHSYATATQCEATSAPDFNDPRCYTLIDTQVTAVSARSNHFTYSLQDPMNQQRLDEVQTDDPAAPVLRTGDTVSVKVYMGKLMALNYAGGNFSIIGAPSSAVDVAVWKKYTNESWVAWSVILGVLFYVIVGWLVLSMWASPGAVTAGRQTNQSSYVA